MDISLRDLERSLSKARLATYRVGARNDTEAICRYIWNMELAQALAPTLHSIEIALRNAIHVAGAPRFGMVEWLRDPAILRLEQREQQMVAGAEDGLCREAGYDLRLIRQGSIPTPPPPPIDDHVAALTFGFWTGLMNAPYQTRLWDTRPGGLNLSAAVFPNAGRRNRQRAAFFPIVNRIRHLRNRISHHEPIWMWRPSLADQHRECLQVIGWISTAMYSVAELLDQFPTVYRHGHNYYATSVRLTR